MAAAIGMSALAAQESAAKTKPKPAKITKAARQQENRRLEDLAMRAAVEVEDALAQGDEALAGSRRQVLLKRFRGTRAGIAARAKQGSMDAEYALAIFDLNGVQGERSPETACGHFLQAAARGFAAAKFRAARCLEEREPDRARSLLREAAEGGHAWALELVGKNCLEASPADPGCAYEKLLGASAAGRPTAQVLLAWMLAQGVGMPADLGRAARLYQQAADKGMASAQNNLGELYETGRGVPADARLALAWYRKSAQAGFVAGEFNYGRALAAGLGGPADFPAAREWLLKAEAGGVVQARTVLDWIQKQPEPPGNIGK